MTNALTSDGATPVFDELLNRMRSGDRPNYGQGEAYLTLTLQSVGGPVPDQFRVLCGNGRELSEDVTDRGKVVEFLRLWLPSANKQVGN